MQTILRVLHWLSWNLEGSLEINKGRALWPKKGKRAKGDPRPYFWATEPFALFTLFWPERPCFIHTQWDLKNSAQSMQYSRNVLRFNLTWVRIPLNCVIYYWSRANELNTILISLEGLFSTFPEFENLVSDRSEHKEG